MDVLLSQSNRGRASWGHPHWDEAIPGVSSFRFTLDNLVNMYDLHRSTFDIPNIYEYLEPN